MWCTQPAIERHRVHMPGIHKANNPINRIQPCAAYNADRAATEQRNNQQADQAPGLGQTKIGWSVQRTDHWDVKALRQLNNDLRDTRQQVNIAVSVEVRRTNTTVNDSLY